MVWDGSTRRYQVFVPASYNVNTPTPVVLAFHGQGSDSKDMQANIGLDAEATRGGFIVAYLDDLTNDWAEGCNCSEADDLGVDDPGFALAVVDTISANYNVDTSRIYALGFSIGGLFVQRLACENSDAFAGVISVASSMSVPLAQTCSPDFPIDVSVVLGSNDPVFPWTGTSNGIFSVLSIDAMTDEWLTNNSCASTPIRTDSSLGSFDLAITSYETCEGGGSFRVYRIENGQHFWYPGTEGIVSDLIDPLVTN